MQGSASQATPALRPFDAGPSRAGTSFHQLCKVRAAPRGSCESDLPDAGRCPSDVWYWVVIVLQDLRVLAGSCAGRPASIAEMMCVARGEYTQEDIEASFLFHMKEVCTRGESSHECRSRVCVRVPYTSIGLLPCLGRFGARHRESLRLDFYQCSMLYAIMLYAVCCSGGGPWRLGVGGSGPGPAIKRGGLLGRA